MSAILLCVTPAPRLNATPPEGFAEPLPVPFDRVDRQADVARDEGRCLVAWVLACTVAAAIVEKIEFTAGDIRLGALGASVLFAVAVLLSVLLASRRPERRWHERRAVTEAARAQMWQWAVGLEPYDDDGAEEQLRLRLAALAEQVGEAGAAVDLAPVAPLREGTADERLRRYVERRLDQQITFYSDRSSRWALASTSWQALGGLAQVLGVVLGLLYAFNRIEADALGPLAAIAAGAVAWTRARDHASLSQVYGATELALTAERASLLERPSQALDVIARIEAILTTEHARWLSRRTVLGLQAG